MIASVGPINSAYTAALSKGAATIGAPPVPVPPSTADTTPVPSSSDPPPDASYAASPLVFKGAATTIPPFVSKGAVTIVPLSVLSVGLAAAPPAAPCQRDESFLCCDWFHDRNPIQVESSS